MKCIMFVCDDDEKANLYTWQLRMLSVTPRPIIWESHICSLNVIVHYGHWDVKHKNFKIGHLSTALYNVGSNVLDSIPTLYIG